VEISCFHDTKIVLRGTLGIEDRDLRLERLERLARVGGW
jgi:hypothetical protein